MDAFFGLQNLGCLNAFPGGAQLDQDPVLRHALGLVHADQLLGLGNLQIGGKVFITFSGDSLTAIFHARNYCCEKNCEVTTNKTGMDQFQDCCKA